MASMASAKVIRLIARVFLCVLTLWSAALHAQGSRPLSAPVEGERLSDWLLRQPGDPRAYPPGLVWQVPSERGAQAGQKRELLVWLALSEAAPAASRENLAQMIKALPATGRVPVALADARWLQAHPKEDPVLHYDHVVLLPGRPGTVSVITNDGKRCTLPHRTGSEARDYLSACEPARIERVDRAWVVQPDGAVRDVGIARWNAQADLGAGARRGLVTAVLHPAGAISVDTELRHDAVCRCASQHRTCRSSDTRRPGTGCDSHVQRLGRHRPLADADSAHGEFGRGTFYL